MFKPNPAFNWSTTIFVVLIVQIIAACMLTTSLYTDSIRAMGTISQLPPINFIYNSTDISWIGAGRTISHMIIASMNLVSGGLCIWYGAARRLRISRLLSIMMGVSLIANSVSMVTTSGVIAYGGWWHVAELISSISAAVAATAATVTFVLVASQLKKVAAIFDGVIQ